MDKQKSTKDIISKTVLDFTKLSVCVLAFMGLIIAVFEHYTPSRQSTAKRALQQYKNPSDTIAYKAQNSR